MTAGSLNATHLTGLATALAGRYRLERELGAGGMATVWLAEDERHRRRVAIKVLHPELSAMLGPERFLKEIELTAGLQHPHILPLFDSGSAEGLLYYVMPYVDGETLRARLERERLLPVAEAVRLAREVADALDYAHRQGVVHRDVKPENVLLHDGHVVVADFGIALAVQQAGGQRMTHTGLSLGTPQYMSPEQATGERTVDARSDVYALAAMTYEMLVGEAPFTGPTVQAIVARVLSESPRPLVPQRRTVPDAVEGAVLRALEKVPADRFATAREFADALDAGTPTARATLARAGTPGLRRAAGAAGAAALLMAGAAAWGWTRRGPAPEVLRYRIRIDSMPVARPWVGETAISPDGGTIVRYGGPDRPLFRRRRSELDFSPIAGTEGGSAPFFSPDGRHLGYFTRSALVVTPLAGGPPTVVRDSTSGPEPASWGDDGYLYESALRDGMGGITRGKPERGAKLEQVTTIDTAAGELWHAFPEPLPGQRGLVFTLSYRDGRRVIAAADPATGRHGRLFDGVRAAFVPSGHLVYSTSDGKLWAVPFDPARRAVTGVARQVGGGLPNTHVGPVDFAVSASGTLAYSVERGTTRRELTWVTRGGIGEPFDSTWRGEFSSPVLSPDGTRLAVSIRDAGRSDIWVRPVAGGVPARLTSEQHRDNVEPAWSPDGRWVSYIAAGVGITGDVWRARADGGGGAELVHRSGRPIAEQVWTPDGELLVRTTTPTPGAGDVLTLRAGVGGVATPLLATPRSEYSPVVSPDGRWLAYASDHSGRLEVYVTSMTAPGTARWMVSTGGGAAPRWSRSGDELFYLDARSRMVSVRLETTPSLAVRGTRVLFDATGYLQSGASRRNYDVSADGRGFLMVRSADGAAPGELVVVEHWAEELRRPER